MELSIIIPIVHHQYIYKCLESIEQCKVYEACDLDIVIVNQSGCRLLLSGNNLKIKEIMLSKRSGSFARNEGANHAKGEWYWFMDDDAYVRRFDRTLSCFANNMVNILIFNRGYEDVEGNYHSDWPRVQKDGLQTLPIESFSRFITEWNFAIRKSLFHSVGGFGDLGVGSVHKAQSGECFVLIWKLYEELKNFSYFLPQIEIAHPKMDDKIFDLFIMKGYSFGQGYSFGLIMHSGDVFYRVLMSVKFIFGTIKIMFRQLSMKKKIGSLWCRLEGFLYGIMNKQPPIYKRNP